MKKKVSRKESREKLERIHLSIELIRVIKRFFPGLWDALSQVRDPRNQSYITYSNCTLMMTRILSAIFYISSMRKSSEELNSRIAIENVGAFCRQELEELPYWETINDQLKRIDPDELSAVIPRMVFDLIRSRAFEDGRIRNRYWQIIIDATQIFSSQKPLDGNYTYRVHNKGKENEYIEYCYYVLEAKIVLRNDIIVSIMSEFIENTDVEYKKQDCERNAALRLLERLKKTFPRLPICISGDSLYAYDGFFQRCEEYGWRFLVRFKEGSIPTMQQEFDALKDLQKNKSKKADGEYDFVTGIDYHGNHINYVHFAQNHGAIFNFLTNLPVTKKNVAETVFFGRRRWTIENQGFNAQKNHGYFIEHLFSRNCQAMKNHYYLIQLAHMISQIMEAWKSLWEKVKLSGEQRHRRLLESWKTERIAEELNKPQKGFQIRFD